MEKSDLNKNVTRGYKNEIDAMSVDTLVIQLTHFNYLTTTLNINEYTTILDLGAGSGKFTHLLDNTMAHIIAVEPFSAMRTVFKKNFPNIEILSGNAGSIPLEDNSIDVIVCAQAFHWFANQSALEEIYRTLKLKGTLGLIWNARDFANLAG